MSHLQLFHLRLTRGLIMRRKRGMRRKDGQWRRDGRAAEWWASLWLRLHGWRILGRRVRTPAGEIDIIARRRRQLIFVEVKQRTRREEALHALRRKQCQRIVRAAACWLAANEWAAHADIRFDLVMVHGGWKIEHVPDAFRPKRTGQP